MGWRPCFSLALLSLLLFVAIAVPAVAQVAPPASAPPAAGADPAVDALIDAARQDGMRVIVIAPDAAAAPAPVPEAATGLSIPAMVETAGQVVKRAGRLLDEIERPGWPAPSSDPWKPVTNGMLTVMGIIAWRWLMHRRGLCFRAFCPEDETEPMPVRVLRGLIGIGIAAALSMIAPFFVSGTGSKTLELVGEIVELFMIAATVALCAVALLERMQRTNPDYGARAEAEVLSFNIRVALVTLLGFVFVTLTVSFAFPQPSVEALFRLGAIMVTFGLCSWLVHRHRAALGLMVEVVSRRPIPWFQRNFWRFAIAALLLASIVAAGRVLLALDDAVGVILAPALATLAGLGTYHVVFFLLTVLFGQGRRDIAEVDQSLIGSPFISIAKAAGTAAAILWFMNDTGMVRVGEGPVGELVLIATVVLLAAQTAWAFTAAAVDRRLALELGASHGAGPTESDGEGGVGLSRIATLLPLMRRTAWVAIWGIAMLMLLYEAGVNITPVFASAGVIGLAIGFGAQSLVRDIISGLFFLVDDAFRMGEYIETGGLKGTVERISIRSMQLRHHNGPLNTIPFGNINDLTNYSRDWVIMKLPIKLTLDTDPERVRKLVKKLGVALLEDPLVGEKFLEPLKSQGVLSIDNWGMTMRVKFKTRPGDQFVTRRVVYAALHEMFEREGIEFASRDVRVKVDAEGRPAPAAAQDAAAGAAPPAQDNASIKAAVATTAATVAMQDSEIMGNDPGGGGSGQGDDR